MQINFPLYPLPCVFFSFHWSPAAHKFPHNVTDDFCQLQTHMLDLTHTLHTNIQMHKNDKAYLIYHNTLYLKTKYLISRKKIETQQSIQWQSGKGPWREQELHKWETLLCRLGGEKKTEDRKLQKTENLNEKAGWIRDSSGFI